MNKMNWLQRTTIATIMYVLGTGCSANDKVTETPLQAPKDPPKQYSAPMPEQSYERFTPEFSTDNYDLSPINRYNRGEFDASSLQRTAAGLNCLTDLLNAMTNKLRRTLGQDIIDTIPEDPEDE